MSDSFNWKRVLTATDSEQQAAAEAVAQEEAAAAPPILDAVEGGLAVDPDRDLTYRPAASPVNVHQVDISEKKYSAGLEKLPQGHSTSNEGHPKVEDCH